MWRTIEGQHLPAVDSVMIVLIKKRDKQLFIFLGFTDTVLNQLVKCFLSLNKCLKRGRAGKQRVECLNCLLATANHRRFYLLRKWFFETNQTDFLNVPHVCENCVKIQAKISESNCETTRIKMWFQPFISQWIHFFKWHYIQSI